MKINTTVLLLLEIGHSLLTVNGAKWYRRRHLLTPAFHFDILKPYVAVYNQCTDVLLVSYYFVNIIAILTVAL